MTKILFFLTLLFFSFSNLYSQDVQLFFSGGYNIGSANLDGLNFVTKRYNDTRTILTKEMEEINRLTGFSFSAGAEFNKYFIFEATYLQKIGETSAEGVINDTAFRRDLRTSVNTLNLGIGAVVFSMSSFKSIFGISFDFGSVGNQTRVYPKSQSTPSYENVDDFITSPMSNTMIGITPYTQINISPGLSNLEIAVKPYYQYFFNKADYSDVNSVINPNTFMNDDPEEQKSSPNNIGVELKLSFIFDVK